MPIQLEIEPVPIELSLFTKNMRFVRQSLGMTQRELAERAGVTIQFINSLETTNASIGIDSMAWISQALKVPLFRLLDPELESQYFDNHSEWWAGYSALVDNSGTIPFERLILSENCRAARKAQSHTQLEVFEHARINKTFLINFEKGITGISLNNILKLSNFLNTPLAALLIPQLSTDNG